MNGAATTRLGAMRAHNGHPEPYHVKFWDIGNEPYGTWQLGRTDLNYYELKHNEFAKAMRKADPSITLLASGAMPDALTTRLQRRCRPTRPTRLLTSTSISRCWSGRDTHRIASASRPMNGRSISGAFRRWWTRRFFYPSTNTPTRARL